MTDTQIRTSQVKDFDASVQALIEDADLAPVNHEHESSGSSGGAFAPQFFTATAGQTAFTLAQAPVSGLMVFRNGLLQTLTTHYTVSGVTLTLVDAAVVGEAISVVYGLGGGSGSSPDDPPTTPNAFDVEFGRDGDTTVPTGGTQIGTLTGATYLEKYGRGSLRIPASTGWNIRAVMFPVPAGTTWTIRAKMEYVGILANYWQAGFYFGNLSNAKLYAFSHDGRGIEYTWWNSPTSYAGESSKFSYYGQWGGPFYLEVKKNSETSYDYAISSDGINFTTVFSAINPTTFLGANVQTIGWGANNEHNTVCYGVCHWMRKVA